MTPSMSTTPARRRHFRIGHRPMASVTALALAWSLLLFVAAPSLAAPGTRVNVDPEQLQGRNRLDRRPDRRGPRCLRRPDGRQRQQHPRAVVLHPVEPEQPEQPGKQPRPPVLDGDVRDLFCELRRCPKRGRTTSARS